jgi:single-strand DNA-binding protein
MNTISISGNLTADPELRSTQSGVSVCSFTVAVRRPHVKDTTDFINCTAWRNTADFVSRYFRKGQRIEVAGCLVQDTWQDKDGNNRTSYKVQCEDVGFGGSKQTDSVQSDNLNTVADDELPF